MNLPWRLLAVLHLDRKEEHLHKLRMRTANSKEEEIEKYKWKRGHLNHYRKIHRKPFAEAIQYLCYCKKWTKSVTVREQDRKELYNQQGRI